MHRGWLAVPLAALLAATACGSTTTAGAQDGQAPGGKEAPTIALFLPESKTTRYEAFDRPLFEAKVKELCPTARSSTTTPTRTPPSSSSRSRPR